MKYITHHRFKGIAACGEHMNIPYGTELDTAGDCIITPEGKAVCFKTSENAKLHFSRNDDGRGLERGALTWAIAYSERRRESRSGMGIYRFSDEEREMLEKDWPHFLREDCDFILFNERFFAAPVEELQKLAEALHIKVRR